jgi:hypothetical protein
MKFKTQNGRVIGWHIWCLHQKCCPISSLLTIQITLDGCLYIYLICSNFPSRSARTFDNIIWTATRNISQYLNVGEAMHSHFLSLPIRGCTWSSNNSGMSRGSHLYLKPYKFCLSRHSYTGVGPLTTSIKYHQRSGMRCLNVIEVSVIRRL